MQTLLNLGTDKNSTIVFPIPLELIRPLMGKPPPGDGERRRPPPRANP